MIKTITTSFFLFLLIGQIQSQTTYTSNGSGAFRAISWTPSTPVDFDAISSDSFIIRDGDAVTLASDINIASLQIGEAGAASSFTFGDGTATVGSLSTGSLIIQSNGTLQVNAFAATHTLDVSGDLVNNGGTLSLNNSGTGVVNTTYSNTVTSVISGSGTSEFNNLTINGGGNLINNLPFTILGDFTITNGVEFTSNGTNITFFGDFTLTASASFNTTGSTTSFDGTVQTIDLIGGTAEFNNIDFDGVGTKTINGDLFTNGGTVQLIDAATIIADQSAGNTHTLYNLELNSQNALDLSGSTIHFMGGEIRFGNDETLDGTIDFGIGAGNALNAVNDVDLILISGNTSIERSDLLVVDGDITIQDAAQLIIQGSDGTVDDATITDHDESHTLTMEATADIYPQGTDNFPTTFGTYDFGSNSFVRYQQAYDQIIRGHDSNGDLIPYANLLLNQGGTKELNSGDDLSVAVDININGGSLFLVDGIVDVTVGDDITNDGDIGNGFEAEDATLNLNGTIGQTLAAFTSGEPYYLRKLIITNPGNVSRTVNLDGNISIEAASGLTFLAQSLFQASNVGGSSSNLLTVDIDANTIFATSSAIRRDELSIGAFTRILTSGTEFAQGFDDVNDLGAFDATSTVRFDSPSDQNIPSISGSYGNIEFNGAGDKYIPSGTTSLTIDGNITRVGGNFVFYLDQSSSSSTISPYTINVSGDWSLRQASTAVNQNNPSSDHTVNFNGGDQQISASNFDNVIWNGTGTKTIQGGLVVAEDFTLVASGIEVTTTGNIDIQGNWSEVAGTTFTQTGGTTNFLGTSTQTVDAQSSSYFNVLDIESGSTLQLASTSIDVNSNFNLRNGGTLDLDGADDAIRSIRIGGTALFDAGSVLSFVNTDASIILDGDIAQNFDNEYTNAVTETYPTLQFEGVGEKDFIDQNLVIEGDLIVASGSTLNGNAEAIDFRGENWTINGNFVHANTVTFSRVGTTTVSASNFNNIVVGDGASATNVVLGGNINLENNLTINDLSTLNASVGNYSIQLEQDWNNYGTFLPGTGTVTFIGNASQIRTDDDIADGTDDEDQVTAKAFYNLRVNNSDAQDVIMEDDEVQDGILTVINDFIVESGNFRFQEDDSGDILTSTLRVGGDFTFLGGTLEYAAANINTIELFANGTSAETHSIDLGGNVVREFQITNNEGDTYQLTNTFEIQDDVDDEFVLNAATSTLDLNGQIMIINRGGLEMADGLLEIDAGSSLVMNDLADDPDFNKTGGDIDLIGTSINPATLTSLDAGGFTFQQSAGDFEANNYNIASTSGNGINITGGSITNFSDGLFTNGIGTSYLTIQTGVDIGTINATGVAFNDGPSFNVNTNINNDNSNEPDGGTITFIIAGGTLSGSASENDDGTDGGGFVRWLNDPGFTWNGSAGDGDWTNSVNWTEDADASVDINGNDIPDEATDIVFINNAGTAPTINSSQDINIGRLTVNSGSVTLNTGELNVDGNVTIFAGASMILTQATDSLKIAGSFANAGILTQNSGKISFDGFDGSHSINSVSDFTELNINGGTDAVYSLGSALTVTSAFSLNGGTFDASSGFTFDIEGDWNVSGGTFSPGIAQVRFSGASAQDISGGTLFNARFLGAGQKNIIGNISVGGEFRIDGAGQVVSENGSSILIFVGGDWNNDLTSGFVANDGSVIFNGEGTQNIDAGLSTTFNNLTFQGNNAVNINESITVNGDLTITTATVNVTLGNTITGVGGDLSMSGGILDIEDTDNFPTGFGTVSLNGGQVRYIYVDNDQIIKGGISYNNLALLSNNNDDASPALNRTLDGDVEVKGALTIGNGNTSYDDFVLVVGANNLTITGENSTGTNHLSLSEDDDITFIGGGTLVHSGSNEWDMDTHLSAVAFENITLSGGRKDVLGDLTINGNLTIGNNVIFDQNANTITNDGGNVFLLGNDAFYYNDSGNSLPQNFATYTISESSLTQLNATGNQTLNAATYGALNLYSDLDITMDGNVTIESDFDMGSQGVLIDGGFDLTLNGDIIDIQNYIPTGTVTFSGSDQAINDFDGEADNLTFLDVVFSGTGTKTLVVNNADEVEILSGGSISISSDVTVTTAELVRFGGSTFSNAGSFITTAQGNPLTFDGSTVALNPGTNDIAALSLVNSSNVTLNTNGLDIGNGEIIVEDGSTLNFGDNLTHNIASDDFLLNATGVLAFGIEGSETTIIFDRTGTQRIPNIDATNNAANIINIPNLTFSGTGQKLLTGSIQANNVTLVSSITELDIDATNQYDIEVRGNWDNQGASFDEHEGLVTFFSNIAASDARTITTNDDQFAEVIIDGVGSSDRTYSLIGDLVIEGEGSGRIGTAGTFETALTITRGTLDLNGNELQLGNNDAGDPTPERSTVAVNGRLIVDEGATLSFNTDDDEGDLGNNLDESAALQVFGRFDVDGISGNPATVTRSSTVDRVTITIESGATIEADNYSFSFLADAGLQVLDGALFAREDAIATANTTFSNGSFNNIATNAGPNTYLVLEADLTSAVFIDNVSFNFDGTPTAGNHFNVERSSAGGNNQITFSNTSGNLGSNGGVYENDPSGAGAISGLLRWDVPSFTTWQGDESSEWRTAGNWDNGLPSASLEAIVPLGSPFNPTLDLDAGDITISGLTVTTGVLRIQDTDGGTPNNITVSGDFLVSSTGTLITNEDAGLTVGGSFEISNSATYDNGGATITLNGATATTPIFATGTESVGSVVISGDADYQFNGTSITIDGDLSVTGAASINPLDNGYVLTIGGDVSFLVGTILNIGIDGDINLNGATGSTQVVTNLKADGLILSGTDAVELSGVTTNDIFTINSGTTATGTGAITWGNDVIIEGTFNGADGVEYTFEGDDWIGGQGSYGNQFGTVVFNYSGANSYIRQVSNVATDSVEFHNIILRGSTNVHLGRFINSVQEDGNIRMSGDLTIENTISELRLNSYLISNNVTETGTLTLQSGERMEVDGLNNFPKDFAVYAIDPTSTVAYEANFDQTIRGGFSYGNLILNNGNTSSLDSDINIQGDLTVSAGNTLDVTSGNYSIRIGGRWDTEAGVTDGNFIAQNGTVIFEGTNDQVVQIGNSGTQNFNIVQLDKSAGRVDLQNTDFVILDDLIIEDGEIDINSRQVSIGGSLDISGSGVLTSNAAGTLLLNASGGSPTIRTNGSNYLGNMIIDATGRTYTMLDDMIIDNVLTITSGTLEVNGHILSVGNTEDVINVFGTLNVSTTDNPGGTLELGNQVQLVVQAGGFINVVGTSDQNATVTRRTTGSYGFTVSGDAMTSGTIGARFYVFEFMDSNGIAIGENGAVNATNNFSDGSFTNGLAGGTYLKIENDQTFLQADGEEIVNIVFSDNPGGGAVNIAKTVSSSGVIELDNYLGDFSGESFDSDPNDLISWLAPSEISWTGLVSTDWFNPDNWSTLALPTITDDVLIPSTPTQATLNPPSIFEGNFGGDDAIAAEAANLTIETGNSLTLNTTDNDGVSGRDLSVAGTVTLETNAALRSIGSDDEIEIGGSLILDGSPVFSPGTGSEFLFNSTSGLVTINTNISFNDLIIDVAGTLNILTNLNVGNDFELTSTAGIFDFNGFDVSVGGNFINSNASASAIDAGANTLTLSPSSATTFTFNPGIVEYYDVRLGDGSTTATYQLTGDLSLSNYLTVSNNTTFDLNTNDVSVGDEIADIETAQINGSVTVEGGEVFSLGNLTELIVSSTGNFQLAGASDANRATLTRKGTLGNYTVDVNSGGEFGAEFYNISYTGEDGIHIASGATLTEALSAADVDFDTNPGDDDLTLRNGTFANGAGTAYLTLENEFTTTLKSDNVVFNTGPTNNVIRNGSLNDIIFVDPSGSMQGPNFENDDQNTASLEATTGNIQWFYNNPLYTWTGAVDSDFTDDANWAEVVSNGTGPNSSNTVIIADVSPITDYPTIVSGPVTLASLTIDAGATLSIADGVTLIVLGDFTNSGTLNIIGGGTLQVEGTITNTGTIIPGATSTVTQVLKESIVFDGGNSFQNLIFDSENNGFTVSTSGPLNVNGDLTITNGATLEVTDALHTITLGGNFSIDETNNGVFNANEGVVLLDGSSAQLIDNTAGGSITFNDITLSGGSIKTFDDDVTINGELTLDDNSTVLALGSTTLTLNSDLTINNGASLDASSSIVQFNGSDIQRISGTGATSNVTFSTLEVNNTTVGNDDLQLGIDVIVSTSINFVTGVISSSASTPVIFNDGATVSYDGVSETTPTGNTIDGDSYVSGPVTKIGDDAFVFPVGEGSRIGRIGISSINNASVTDQYSAEYFFSAPANTEATKNGGIVRVSYLEYWDLSNVNAHAGEPLVTLFWDNTSEVTQTGSLTVAHYNGSSWDDEGNGSITGLTSAGTITSANNLTSFSPITLATTNDATNPLPVELISFDGIASDGKITLNWVTASELNNDYFEVQHSLNGIEFSSIGKVNGNGTTNEVTSYQLVDGSPRLGLNYYRLRQVDYDGTEEFHSLIQVNNDHFRSTFDVTFYPNPATDENMNLRILSGDDHSPILVKLIDLTGKVYYQKSLEGSLSIDQQITPSKPLVSGVYFLIINQNEETTKKKIIIK